VFGPATWNSLPPSLRAPELSSDIYLGNIFPVSFLHFLPFPFHSLPHLQVNHEIRYGRQGLIFQRWAPELFSSPGPQFVPATLWFPGPVFQWRALKLINDPLSVLSMISCFFSNFVKFCKSIQHCEFTIVKCEIWMTH